MIAKRRVILLLSLLLVLSGCVFNEDSENIVLQVLADDQTKDQVIKQANYTQEYITVEEPIIGTKQNKIEYRESNGQGYPWMAAKVSDATDARSKVTLLKTYNQFNEVVSSVRVPGTEVYTEAEPTVFQYGQTAKVGAVWNPRRVTRYGYDCDGCSVTSDDFSGSASGIKFSGNKIRQFDGSWKNGLTYGGMHVIATSNAIPMCTVVEISNHQFSGGGITKGQPFLAIVGNRGVSGSDIDLFAGSEKNLGAISQSGSPSAGTTKVEIVGFKTYVRNNGCK
ncbi:MAG: hypothetical protein GX074_03160 [Erysipelothrix sp.]|nr:hypothetical protein [Erysipelothrix sp.]